MESTPWFDTYKAEFFRTLLFNDHETFDHPLACASLPRSSGHKATQSPQAQLLHDGNVCNIPNSGHQVHSDRLQRLSSCSMMLPNLLRHIQRAVAVNWPGST